MKDMKIVLPGGAGLVGQNLVAHLKRAGYRNLVVLDKHRANLDVLRRVQPDITVVEADLAEHGDWARHFEGAGAVLPGKRGVKPGLALGFYGADLPRRRCSSRRGMISTKLQGMCR